MLFCKRVLKQREDISRYGNTIVFFGGGGQYVLIFSVKIAYLKIFFMSLSTKLVGKEFFFNTSFRLFTSS